jgi:hypothetical protein
MKRQCERRWTVSEETQKAIALLRQIVDDEETTRLVLAANPELKERLRKALDIPKRPKVVCLCGSTRFTTDMACIRWALERDEGYIVLGWHLLPTDHPDLKGTDGTHAAENVGRKEHFNELHKRKIDLSDEVLVLNIGGYIGEDTRSEIAYAEAHGKPVRYLEPRR